MRVITELIQGQVGKVEQLTKEAEDFLGWAEGFKIRYFDLFDFEHLTEEQVEVVKEEVLLAPHRILLEDEAVFEGPHTFRCRQVIGQYNEEEEMLQQMLTKLLGFEEGVVHHSEVFVIEGITDEQFAEFKKYYLNPVEKVEVALDAPNPKLQPTPTTELEEVSGFCQLEDADLRAFGEQFAMDFDDLKLCQAYFQAEGREPKLIELKVIDTYWSDHCRHTTFNTHLNEIEIEAGPYNALFHAALDDYFKQREALQRSQRPITLMDLGTIQTKVLKSEGKLKDVEVSAEINACALEIKVDVDGEEEDWILYFKNETHNHPTEIEPFGGASTCLGGGVRDPLSGRSWVYQAMRIGGGMNPLQAFSDVRADKLPQRTISRQALAGYSDYANQYGVTGGYNEEVYHPGFEAKRLEIGALISAAPQENIVKEEPAAGDRIILLGGRTGRDGLGGAVGSSMIQTEESLETAGAEVQKGNASMERKIGRLFRNGQATRLIKRCNDFGAGGVSVAVGELADGVNIQLDEVPLKYPGMHGGEIAIAESQERMAAVVPLQDVEEFMQYAAEEDVEATIIAEVTDSKRMVMHWDGEVIVDLSREFLDSNGAPKSAQARLVNPSEKPFPTPSFDFTKENVLEFATRLDEASQKAADEQFDASIGRSTVLYPYGGKYRQTKELGMISRLPVDQGKTQTTSGMAYGYHPYLAERSPFHGGFYAVVESVAKLVALGFNYENVRLTFQEYFESLGEDAVKWGKPLLALLGANQVMKALELAAIGGKDSMSGTFEELTVPPTLASFAVASGRIEDVVSRAFKSAGQPVVLIEQKLQEDDTIDLEAFAKTLEAIHHLIQKGKVRAASTVGYKGLLSELLNMSYGNYVGVKLEEAILPRLTHAMMGSFVLEVEDVEVLDDLSYEIIGYTQEGSLSAGEVDVDLEEVYEASQAPLASVFDAVKKETHACPAFVDTNYDKRSAEKNPRVLIPVILGSNTEYDLKDAFVAAGFEADFYIIHTSTYAAYQRSLEEFADLLRDYQVLALSSGYVFANEPSESGRAWDLVLKDERVSRAVHNHLAQGRLIYGAGSAGASLVRTGLIEFGRIQEGTHLQVNQNPYGKFIADILPTCLVSQNSAWSFAAERGQFQTALATQWGVIDLGDRYDSFMANGQVLSAFCEYFTTPAVDALTSPEGLVFASVSKPERMDQDLYVNLDIQALPAFIQSARRYFE